MKQSPAVLHVEVSRVILVPPAQVTGLYLDYMNWHKLFPLTIRGTKLISDDGKRQIIEVDHKKAGKVINILTVVNNEEIKLEEFKRIFDGTFINRFEAIPMMGTRYVVDAYISLKGWYRLLRPFAKPVIRNRVNKYVLDPMKIYAEGMQL